MTAQLVRVAMVAALFALAACTERGPVAQQRVPGGDAALGPGIMVAYGCGSCHVIPGVAAASGRVGPPLTDFAARSYVAGRLRNEPGSLVRWIRDPQSVSPGTVMPDLGVTDTDARHIAAYLYTLSSGSRLGPPHLFPESSIPGH